MLDNLLSRLEKVRHVGRGKWMARCPVHDDRDPSLSIGQTDDGRVLLYCFGCGAKGPEILEAVDMTLDDVQAPMWHHDRNVRFHVIPHESLVHRLPHLTKAPHGYYADCPECGGRLSVSCTLEEGRLFMRCTQGCSLDKHLSDVIKDWKTMSTNTARSVDFHLRVVQALLENEETT